MSALPIPSRYDQHVTALALGIQTYSSLDAGIVPGLRVRHEVIPRPVGAWRRWRPGETVDAFLPAFPRHRGGRHARRYDELSTLVLALRLVVPQGDRTVVPRRITVDLDPLTPTPPPLSRRRRLIGMFPGASAPLPGGATIIRGRVVDQSDIRLPMRWPRAVVRDGNGNELGWAHGDERGEFLLVVGLAPGANTMPPQTRNLTVQAAAQAPGVPPLDDPDLQRLDPLWDLPVDDVDEHPSPTLDPIASGRRLHPTQTRQQVATIPVTTGRVHTVQIAL